MSERTRTICLWSESNGTKTSQAYHRIKRMYERTGKTCRAIYSDKGGAAPLIDSGMVDAGIVDLWDITDRQDIAMSTLTNIVRGYWYLTTVSGKKTVRPEPMFQTTKEQWDKIGLYLFEGGTSISMLIARGIANSPEKKGFGRSFHYDEGGYSYGGISEYHIGMIQNYIFDLLTQGVANLNVEEIIWTFHDGKGQDRNKQISHLAPEIIGSAMNSKVAKEFWDMIHLCRETVTVRDSNGLEVTEQRVMAYFTDHPDMVTQLPCKAKIRVLPELYPLLLNKWPNGGITMSYDQGINELYDAIDKLKVKGRELGNRWIEGVRRKHEQEGIKDHSTEERTRHPNGGIGQVNGGTDKENRTEKQETVTIISNANDSTESEVKTTTSDWGI